MGLVWDATSFSLGRFPISRDPPEGGTLGVVSLPTREDVSFQFLGIPPKGERQFCVHPA